MSETKILFTFKDEEGDFVVESLWAERKGMFYQINNIPFFAINIAYGDLVSAVEEDDELHFDEVIEVSGHSTIQMIIFRDGDAREIGATFEHLGCSWEGSHAKNYIAIDVPKEIDYKLIKPLLEEGRESGRWDYKEACLGQL